MPRARPVDQCPRLPTARAPISWTRRRVLAELLNPAAINGINIEAERRPGLLSRQEVAEFARYDRLQLRRG